MKHETKILGGQNRFSEVDLFSRSNRILNNTKAKLGLWITLVLVVLGLAWGLWFFLADVPVYEISTEARIEVTGASHPVVALISGKVVSNRMRLNRKVAAGEVLIEIDSQDEQLKLAQTRTRLRALGEELKALEKEIASEELSLKAYAKASLIKINEMQQKYESIRTMARFSEQRTERIQTLSEKGALTRSQAEHSQAEAKSKMAEARSLELSLDRLEWERISRIHEHQGRIDEINSDIRRLQGERATLRAKSQRFVYQIELHHICAPVAGRIADCGAFPVGAVVKSGDRLGTVLPNRDLLIAAMFTPQGALGRIRPGQPANLRFHGFPWAQYGTLSACVTRVASEVRHKKIRVELELDEAQSSAIPLQHGLPCLVEVQIERVSPAALALRSVGKVITPVPKETSGEHHPIEVWP